MYFLVAFDLIQKNGVPVWVEVWDKVREIKKTLKEQQNCAGLLTVLTSAVRGGGGEWPAVNSKDFAGKASTPTGIIPSRPERVFTKRNADTTDLTRDFQ